MDNMILNVKKNFFVFCVYSIVMAACAASLSAETVPVMTSSSAQAMRGSQTSPVTSVPNLYRYTLDNGLSLFVLENNTAPLAFVQIAVRTGAVSQTPQTAGLFHLYEHMMFKGNAKYKNQQEVTAALNKMGVSDWNGSTGIDEVNYYVTVPSSLVRDGLEFWSYAIRTPLLDEKQLANEKKVVLAEISGNFSDPSRIFLSAVSKHLFAESPWRLDSGGNPQTVANATVEQLREIQSTYYVPNNAALFVGGDVHHEEVYRMVRDLYGDWKKSSAPVPFAPSPVKTPFSSEQKYVYADPQVSQEHTQVLQYLRGPDAETDSVDTYAADVWTEILDNPSGFFKKIFLSDEELSIPDADYLFGFYSTQRASGMICFSAVMLNDEKKSPVVKTEKFIDDINNKAIPMMTDESTFASVIDSAKNQMRNSREYKLETPAGFLSSFSNMWSAAGESYFFTYDDSVASVKESDIVSFAKKYLQNKYGMTVVLVNPDVYDAHKTEFEKAGYKEITADSSFWWKSGSSK